MEARASGWIEKVYVNYVGEPILLLAARDPAA